MKGEIRVIPIGGLPEIHPGDDLSHMMAAAIREADIELEEGDVVVVAQKVVSKADGLLVPLDTIEPSVMAESFAATWSKDPRQVEVVLREAKRIVRMERGVLIVETRHGLICANAGVDASNVEGQDMVCLLPPDPDASAEKLRQGLREHAGVAPGVIISDTFGRAWREGQTNIAIGAAGMSAMRSYVGEHDPSGYELRVTSLCVADELAGAAELVMGKIDRVPVAVVRGFDIQPGEGGAQVIVRPPERDLFH